MTSSIEREIVTSGDLPQLQRACIREIKALDSNLPNKLIPQIQVASSVNGLLNTLTNSEYWNWFDTRLLTAVTQASGSPEAIKSLEKYKATYYSRKVSDLILCEYKIKPFKNFVPLVEKYKKDPSKLTILDLQKHQYEIEKVVEGGLALIEIKTGCVELTWQIPQELVYRAYTSMKRKHDELASLAVKSLVCGEADELAGLPILWHGQEVGEVGPIEPLPEHVRQQPYSLPQGFQWVTLSDSNVKKAAKFLSRYHTGNTLLTNFCEDTIIFHLTSPIVKNEWNFGIQTTDGRLVAIILASPNYICIGKEIKLFISITKKYHRNYQYKRIGYMLIKELQRRANLSKINQLLLPSNAILKPVCTIVNWIQMLNKPGTSYPLPSSPRTPGWRRMTSEDVPSALALINKWSSQFQIRQVFNSKEEFSHIFLHQKFIICYVVEDETNNITDFVAYTQSSVLRADIIAVVSTQSSVKQLIIDALVCARENGALSASIVQYNMENDVLASLSFQPYDCHTLHFYNYRHDEISQSQVWILNM